MISFDEAQEHVTVRLERLGEDLAVAPLELLPAMCLGTDVKGPELVARLLRDVAVFGELLSTEDDPRAILMGLFARNFWLGYEFGKAFEG